MECVMKGGYKPVIFDEICNLNSQNETTVSGEDFFVDQLLNLNDGDSIEEEEEEEEEGENGFLVAKGEPLAESQETNKVSAFLSPSLDRDDFGSVLSVPAEEPDLEWLSLFVEESFSSPYLSGLGPISNKPDSKPETGSKTHKVSSFSPPPALNKSRRSKRARTGGRVWYTSLAESSSPLSSSYPSSPNPNPNLGPAMPRKQRKREGGPGFGSPRRCSHCGAQKTPQWRAGPHGPKTLCNACGVRFKSGRLLPEYRPACSPTFSSELHSNSHRKVLEMRKKKESTMSD